MNGGKFRRCITTMHANQNGAAQIIQCNEWIKGNDLKIKHSVWHFEDFNNYTELYDITLTALRRLRAPLLHNAQKWEPHHICVQRVSPLGAWLIKNSVSVPANTAEFVGERGTCVAVKLRGWINEVKVIIRLWMLVEPVQREPSAIGSGLPAPPHAHPRWPHKFPKGRPESCVTFSLTLRGGRF